jgi:GTP diphosphokinase / guanosine-3',5'-bis(diphosphate) 3'-diphosphatase
LRLFKKLRRKLDYLDEEHVDKIHQAYLTALDAHRGQKRRTGEPYVTHPVAVACILADMRMDHQSIMAALLHDVIEDTPVTKEALEAKFGVQVAALVDGVSKLTQIEFVSRAEEQAENFRKMVLAMAKDIRVILVKLADRLHNMRTMGSLPSEKRQRKAKETLEIFAPVAKRLGMRGFSVELEELGFATMFPRRHAILKDSVRRARGNRKKVLALIEKTFEEGFADSALPSCTIKGREKHLYSIYRKMKIKRIPFNEIMDVYAFRIIVDDPDTCYRVLGLVHSLFKPVPERFKDYIAIPKANGYQSLHTTLFGPYGLPIEVQIRTTEMDRMAANGIAAHWLYKSSDQEMSRSQLRAQQWVQNLLELQKNAGTSLEFIESVKVDLFPDEVYVFTPRGKIMELPSGATAVDFAYIVHTDVGNTCVAVKVDRKLVPLSTPLSNGQTIEVITAPRGRPNPVWLDFVVTSKARSGIRHYLKNQRQAESIVLGSQLLQKALATHRLSLKKIPESVITLFLKETKLTSFDDLLVEIGLGNRVSLLVAQRLSDMIGESDEEAVREKTQAQVPMVIKGTEGMLVSYAACCCPLPGDPIVGILNIGKGIMVHVDRCKRISKLQRHPERTMPLRWSEDASGNFLVSIRIDVLNQRGVLAVLALAVSDADSNIEDISVEDRDGRHYSVIFKVIVNDRPHLARVLRSLRQVPAVLKITRGL